MSNQRATYDIDIVLCIDITRSMIPVIDEAKINSLRFHEKLQTSMDKEGKAFNSLRVKVIAFRDYYDNESDAINETKFFTLPDETDDFSAFVNSLEADGGGDEPESGLEALSLAMNSEWKTDNTKRREIIVIWTDASAHPLDSEKIKPDNYPSDIPKNFTELTCAWEDEQDIQESKPSSARRLVLFAPDAEPWTTMAVQWDQVTQIQSKGGEGLEECTFDEIIEKIKNSIVA